MKKILVINGPNLNMLGVREPEIYGAMTQDELFAYISAEAGKLGVDVTFFQSNHEGAIIDRIHAARGSADGIVINPGAFTHYSYAIMDAIKAAGVPAVEVHISNIHAREEFRSRSVTAQACLGQISGLGALGYVLALKALTE